MHGNPKGAPKVVVHGHNGAGPGALPKAHCRGKPAGKPSPCTVMCVPPPTSASGHARGAQWNAALHRSLTGTPSRRLFQEVIDWAISKDPTLSVHTQLSLEAARRVYQLQVVRFCKLWVVILSVVKRKSGYFHFSTVVCCTENTKQLLHT